MTIAFRIIKPIPKLEDPEWQSCNINKPIPKHENGNPVEDGALLRGGGWYGLKSAGATWRSCNNLIVIMRSQANALLLTVH